MTNPRKRKARIREALQQAAERAKTEQEQELVRKAAAIALRVGKLNQEEVNEALNSINKENDNAEKKQTVKKPAKKTTKKGSPKKRSTRKRTTKPKE